MKISLRSLFIAGFFSLAAVCVQAAEVLSEAVVLKLNGPVEVILPGKTESSSVKVGDKLPQGTTIVTSSTGEIDVQVFPGTVSTIKSDTKVELEKLSLTSSDGVVTKQSAVINLKAGIVESELDHTKRSINDYSIRTPKGVAAARGTKYVVVVIGQYTFVKVTEGTVKVTSGSNSQDVTKDQVYKISPNGDISLSSDLELGILKGIKTPTTETTHDKDSKTNDVDVTIVSPSAP